MSLGIDVNRHNRPTGMSGLGTLCRVTQRTEEDARFENRLRAHVRWKMERRRLGVTALADVVGFEQSYISRWLMGGRGSRGISALFAYKFSQALDVDPDILFNQDPPAQFWRTYVPRPQPEDPGEASPATARATRPMGRAAESVAKYHHEKKAR